MVIVELIGSISLAIAFVSAIALTIIHIKNKQNDTTYIHDHSSLVLPFEKFNQDLSIISPSKTILNKEFPIINVINNDEISSSPIKYGIQWKTLSLNDDDQSNIIKTSEFEQGDTLSLSNQTISVRNLIEKFENNSIEKISRKEKTNQSNFDLTSIDTNFDSQTIKNDFNHNYSSISNLDVTIPSNLSSSIDLEQFECFSTTSSLSEFLNNH